MGDCSSKESAAADGSAKPSYVRPPAAARPAAAAPSKPKEPEFVAGKQVGDRILLPPKHCANKHPPSAHLPFTVVDIGGSKAIGKRCDYCEKRQSSTTIGKETFMAGGQSNFLLSAA
jgi:hypothetical protein